MDVEKADYDTLFPAATTLATAGGLSAEFQNDLILTGSLRGCHIQVQGQLVADDAEIAGGVLHLCGPARVGTLGDPQATPTRIVIAATGGPDPKLAAALKVLEEERIAITTMRSQIAMLEDDSSQFDHTQREEMTLAMFDLPDQQAALDRLAKLAEAAQERFGADEGDKPSFNVSGMIHRGVTIVFADAGTGSTWTCEEELSGPLVVSAAADGTVTLASADGAVRPAPSAANTDPSPAEEESTASAATELAATDRTVYRQAVGG